MKVRLFTGFVKAALHWIQKSHNLPWQIYHETDDRSALDRKRTGPVEFTSVNGSSVYAPYHEAAGLLNKVSKTKR